MRFDNVLYIIGNGFDLHHDLKSSYQDFADWLKKNKRELYETLSDVCKVDYLWKDFERALADVNRDYFIGMGEIFLPSHWTEDDGYAELFYAQDYVREEADILWNNIQKWFRKWVRTVKWEKGSNAKKLRIDFDARFITFNFTPFLETQYGISSENILYIHGRTNDPKQPPIIGHDGRDTYDEWYKTAGKSTKRHYRGKHSMLPEVKMMTGSVEEFYSISEKPVQEILMRHRGFINNLYDVKHIYVLGHSLGDVDMPYFKAINDVNTSPKDLQWKVSYYSEQEKVNLKEKLKRSVLTEGATVEMITIESLRPR